jgi:hypothetical protein
MGQFSGIKVKVKSAIIFVLCFSILIALTSLFAFFNNEFIWFGLLFSILYYILLGIGLLYYMNTKFFKGIGIMESMLGNFFIFLIVSILSCWIYYLVFNLISTSGYAHYIMLTILWVFVPFLYSELKQKYIAIPDAFYDRWKVGSGRTDNEYWDNIDKFHLMQVSINIKKRSDSEFFSKFDVKIAQEVNLGSWFDKFIEDQNYRFPNDAIETNATDTNIGWVFYTSKYFKFPLFIRNLDPTKPIAESNIKNKQVIFAKRVALNNIPESNSSEN